MPCRQSAFRGIPRLKGQSDQGARLEMAIRKNLRGLGYEG